ncbi:MAG TPA: tRNA isopentenyl-2-thiomethyl-A-37 hydroxylase MiaE [Polyangia bacterium]
MIEIAPSSEAWVRAACDALPTLLVDHAHCEKRAAQTAVRFLFQYPDWPRLCTQMSRLAREELVHFDQVLRELKTRAIPFRALPSSNYATELFAACDKGSAVDTLLACALIEARSHERFVRLAAAVPDPPLRAFYLDLAEAEARHGEIYVELAEEKSKGDVAARLRALAHREAEIVARPGQPLRMHAGG